MRARRVLVAVVAVIVALGAAVVVLGSLDPAEDDPDAVTAGEGEGGEAVEALAVPKGVTLTAAGVTRRGVPVSVCWSEDGIAAICRDTVAPRSFDLLQVRAGERITVDLDADAAPGSLGISARPPDADPMDDSVVRETELAAETHTAYEVDLPAGTWHVDVCAHFEHHGDPCWLFELEVSPA